MKIWNKFLTKHFRKKGYKKEYLKLRVAEDKKNALMGLIILTILVICIGTIMYLPYFNIVSTLSNAYYGSVSNIYKSDDIVFSIAKVCNNFDEEEKQIRCVNNFVKEFYYYDGHKEDKKVFRTPSEIINLGGCCRDYSIFYKAIFSLMGFDSEFIYEPNHVYIRVFGKDNNYIVDQKYYSVEKK